MIIGVDIGTTSVKVLAASLAGEEHYSLERTYQINEPEMGYREQDPDELQNAVESTIVEVVKKTALPIQALCFSAATHSILGIDEHGDPVTPVIIWADQRSVSYAQKLRKSSKGLRIYQRSGAPIHAMLPLCKIAWMRDHQPAFFKRVYKFFSIKEYLFYKWFGIAVVDHSIASATGLFDSTTLRWDAEALEFAGISTELLSEPVPTTYVVKASLALSQKFSIPVDTPFVIGASDGCLANLNASGLNAKEATLTLGTSGAIRIISEQYQYDPKMRVFNYLLTDQYHVIGGPTNHGGIVLEWLLEKLYPDMSDYDEVLERVQSIAAGSEGLICIPYFYGERAPVWDEEAKGRFIGIQSHHSRDHFARAALEGIIFNLLNIREGLEAATRSKIEAVWADGGLTRSDLVIQLIADVFDLPVYVSASSHGVDRGAILLGAYALGLIDSLEVKPNRERAFYPDKTAQEALKLNYEMFKNALITHEVK